MILRILFLALILAGGGIALGLGVGALGCAAAFIIPTAIINLMALPCAVYI